MGKSGTEYRYYFKNGKPVKIEGFEIRDLFEEPAYKSIHKQLLELPADQYISLFRLMAAYMTDCEIVKDLFGDVSVHIEC